jgi:hypothetical protein
MRYIWFFHSLNPYIRTPGAIPYIRAMLGAQSTQSLATPLQATPPPLALPGTLQAFRPVPKRPGVGSEEGQLRDR